MRGSRRTCTTKMTMATTSSTKFHGKHSSRKRRSREYPGFFSFEVARSEKVCIIVSHRKQKCETKMKKVITPIATKALLGAGFTHMISFGRALSTTFVKTYASINGPREVVIHIHEARGNFHFAGEFQSEGRNILSACSGAGFIPCEIENPEKWVAKYIADADRAVKESYAVRLLNK